MNKNHIRRNEILSDCWDTSYVHKSVDFDEDIRVFRHLTLEKLQVLIDEDFIELDEAQNDGPRVFDFLSFLRSYPTAKCCGYAVGHKRPDYRVTINGIVIPDNASPELIRAFRKEFRNADEFTGFFAWWD